MRWILIAAAVFFVMRQRNGGGVGGGEFQVTGFTGDEVEVNDVEI